MYEGRLSGLGSVPQRRAGALHARLHARGRQAQAHRRVGLPSTLTPARFSGRTWRRTTDPVLLTTLGIAAARPSHQRATLRRAAAEVSTAPNRYQTVVVGPGEHRGEHLLVAQRNTKVRAGIGAVHAAQQGSRGDERLPQCSRDLVPCRRRESGRLVRRTGELHATDQGSRYDTHGAVLATRRPGISWKDSYSPRLSLDLQSEIQSGARPRLARRRRQRPNRGAGHVVAWARSPDEVWTSTAGARSPQLLRPRRGASSSRTSAHRLDVASRTRGARSASGVTAI